jgi:hypothetical protein
MVIVSADGSVHSEMELQVVDPNLKNRTYIYSKAVHSTFGPPQIGDSFLDRTLSKMIVF